jgi:hypothetical protein
VEGVQPQLRLVQLLFYINPETIRSSSPNGAVAQTEIAPENSIRQSGLIMQL